MKQIPKNCRRKFLTGFTLIELLVVVALITLLSSIVMASLSNQRKKARDTKRITSLREVITALELHYSTYGRFPCHDLLFSNGDPDNFLRILVDRGFLSSVPRDPGGLRYEYATIKKVAKSKGGACGQIAFLGMYSEDNPAKCPPYGKLGVDSGAGVGASQHCHILYPETLAPPCFPWFVLHESLYTNPPYNASPYNRIACNSDYMDQASENEF